MLEIEQRKFGAEKMTPNHISGARNLTIYFAKWCGTCAKVVPKLMVLAERAGFSIQLIDVADPNNRVQCSHVGWVPYIEYNGAEISVDDFVQLVSEHAGEEG
jgi:hypothetical protein